MAISDYAEWLFNDRMNHLRLGEIHLPLVSDFQSFPLGKKLQTHFKYKVIISMFFQNSKMIDNNT